MCLLKWWSLPASLSRVPFKLIALKLIFFAKFLSSIYKFRLRRELEADPVGSPNMSAIAEVAFLDIYRVHK